MEQLQRPEVVHFHLAPGLIEDCRIGDSSRERYAGVVEDELDVRNGLHDFADLVRVRHIEPQRNESLVTLGAQRLGIACRGMDRSHTAGQERFRQGSSDAAVGARHQGDRSFDFLRVHRLFLSCGCDFVVVGHEIDLAPGNGTLGVTSLTGFRWTR